MTDAAPRRFSLRNLWRTTTVRLTAIFIAIFVGFAVLLLGLIAYQTSVQIQREQYRAVEREVAQIRLLSSQSSVRAVAFAVQRLADRPGPGIYYLGDPTGTMIAGNVSDFPTAVISEAGRFELEYQRGREIYGGPEEDVPTHGVAIVESLELSNGLRLVIGRDVGERRGFNAIILRTFFAGALGIIVLSLIAGGLTARYVLRRIDGITETSSKIMSGNLSERVPVTGRDDEFDAVATSLNAMLGRIEKLMVGLKEVTDNVAHDLKTPLTRLRNKAEAALRDTDPDRQRLALETTIAESDQLIRTFNALLLIARAEAGTSTGAFSRIDLSEIVADVAELYQPVAEDAGLGLETAVEPGLTLDANRELIGQALVNLVENAIKYGQSAEGDGSITIAARREPGRIVVEVADRGPGISEADRTRVFERFARLETSRTEPGAGLGLALVAAVVHLHGGTIRFEDSAPGARAVITFPAG
ncbi:sensor histidine kinase [Pelagibacterium lacus]|uniref:histidine kinase n=1 Tax=Pelagibacterium lacus TaxID=2282655 RepID=A0A369W8R1_9HYPH|nr:ATP-binding protein [Pelagibacterium lacus]RDE10447.1 HAMP domain-containing protein [Pelagibacterium lacus]